MNFFDKLPANLRATSYSAGEEHAWSMQDTIIVIEQLRKLDLALCGIEIWLPADHGPIIPTPFIYGWAIEPEKNEEWKKFKDRSRNEAIEYLNSFSWDRNDVAHQNLIPYFNLTVCSKDNF